MIPGVSPSGQTVNGNNMVYYRSGHGTPVLLVHGITTYSIRDHTQYLHEFVTTLENFWGGSPGYV